MLVRSRNEQPRLSLVSVALPLQLPSLGLTADFAVPLASGSAILRGILLGGTVVSSHVIYHSSHLLFPFYALP